MGVWSKRRSLNVPPTKLEQTKNTSKLLQPPSNLYENNENKEKNKPLSKEMETQKKSAPALKRHPASNLLMAGMQICSWVVRRSCNRFRSVWEIFGRSRRSTGSPCTASSSTFTRRFSSPRPATFFRPPAQ